MEKFEIDEKEVTQIVETMKNKYREQGINFEEVDTNLKELRGLISNDAYAKIDLETEEDLDNFSSDFARKIGAFYLKLRKILKPVQKFLKNLPIGSEIGFYLYSANMQYSTSQYLALASAGGFIAALIALIVTAIIGLTMPNLLLKIVLPILFAFIAWIVATLLILFIPKQKAVSRGNGCSVELPFALRHMATELKAGIGLYKTIQTIAVNDYGTLSEEFARTINEIEEGSDTRIALKHLALRTQSRPLKKTINHLLRAMRIGGNLSNTLNDIAEDVSEDIKNNITIFSQNMNFFAVIFIFAGIVLPVAIMILGAIRNSPIAATGQELFQNIPLTPPVLFIFFLVVMPLIFAMLIGIVYKSQPQV